MSDTVTPAKFVGNIILRGKFECLTGLHIGGSKEKLEIGGVDSPVVRDPRTRLPYVPGSSLKGKMRSLLEFGLGVVPVDRKDDKGIDMTGNVSDDPAIVRLFGYGVDELEKAEKDKKPENPLFRIGPSRLIVRDCYPDEATQKWWKSLDTDLLYTEYKSENGINRITSAANPRFVERVAASSRFDVELVYTVYEIPKENTEEYSPKDDLNNLRMALLMLEHNFLGKSGTRGYGRVKFGFMEPIWLTQKDYITNSSALASANDPIPDFKNLKPTGDLKFEISSTPQ